MSPRDDGSRPAMQTSVRAHSAARRRYLLVHGWGSRGATWDRLADSLSSDDTLVIVDLRGHGASPTGPAGSATVRRMAADLADLIIEMGGGQVVAVGHSMGGNVVTVLAVDHPELVEALIVIDPAYGADAQEMATTSGRFLDYREHGGRTPAREMPGAFSPHAPAELVERARASVLATGADVLATAFRSIYLDDEPFGSRHDALAYLSRRTRPTLALYPSEARAETERAAGGDATIRIAPVESHFIHEEAPAWVADRIREWIPPLR